MSKRSLYEQISTKKAKPTLPPWAVQLDQLGYCVVPGILTAAECDAALASLHGYLANAGVDIVTPKRAKDYPNTHGIIQHLEIGHCQAVWNVRTNDRVQDVFAQIYGTNDLLTSFDGACIMQPWHRFGTKSWLHMDQAPKNTERRCIQGYVNLTDSSTDSTGSLMVLPGSHRKFGSFFEKFPDMRVTVDKNGKKKPRGNWVKLEVDAHWQFFGVEKTRVHGPKGSMVLWDSRTVHQNTPPLCTNGPAQQRAVVYTCFQPRSLISDSNLLKKQRAFDEYRMTTHWPADSVILFQKQPRTYGADVPVYTPVRDRVESQRMLELAGKLEMTSVAEWSATPLLAFG